MFTQVLPNEIRSGTSVTAHAVRPRRPSPVPPVFQTLGRNPALAVPRGTRQTEYEKKTKQRVGRCSRTWAAIFCGLRALDRWSAARTQPAEPSQSLRNYPPRR